MLKKIFLIGSSGFVGTNLYNNLKEKFNIQLYKKGIPIHIDANIVINFAGKAHDLKKILISQEYYDVNTFFSNDVFDAFIDSNAEVFITLSSVKAVADKLENVLNEDHIPRPKTHYGKSKLLAEQYILNKECPEGKRIYILRPCMIHGPGNKGNLNILFNFVKNGIPWPLGAYENKRSFCSIDNLIFIINELIANDQIPSGIYNVSDCEPVSTNELIRLISLSLNKKTYIWKIPKFLIYTFSKLGNFLNLPLNTESLNKLTETYIVSNNKILKSINKPLPLSSKEGLTKSFNSFSH
jgi:nucleoside-diphosphate-sugar epimerase